MNTHSKPSPSSLNESASTTPNDLKRRSPVEIVLDSLPVRSTLQLPSQSPEECVVIVVVNDKIIGAMVGGGRCGLELVAFNTTQDQADFAHKIFHNFSYTDGFSANEREFLLSVSKLPSIRINLADPNAVEQVEKFCRVKAGG
jgi:hypothetical protein